MNTRIAVIALAAAQLAGCAAPRLPEAASVFQQEALVEAKAPPPEDKEAKARLSLLDRLPKPAAEAPLPASKLYTFVARALPVRQAMEQFARTYGINVVLDSDVTATITVEFRNLPLDKALEAMLEAHGLSWEWDGGLLRVTRLATKTFALDYLRLVRAGNSSSTTNTSSGGAGSSSDTARVGVSRTDSINFWDEVQRQLEDILTMGRDDYAAAGEQPPQQTTVMADRVTNTTTTATTPVRERMGRLIINRVAGSIQVTTSRARMRAVETYLEALRRKTLRQVYIDVRVVEVSLGANKALGVDWNRVNMGAVVLSAVSGASGIAGATLSANYTKSFAATHLVKDVNALITALQEQGNVKVVSQPRIRTLNNQPAVVKSGTERTFFATTTVVTPVAGGAPLVTTTNTPQTVTEGVVLGVTPQISDDGRIALDVSPAITRISGVDTSPDGLSNAPRLDIKQTTTMVRVGDGESVVIGGLIEEVDEVIDRGMPGLSSAPGVGALFGTKTQSKARRELVIILTPYVVE